MSAPADRIPDPLLAPGEEELDQTLRPRRLSEFVGQEAVKEQLSIFLEAARARKEPCEHVLLAGPPGLGKTSLAGIIAAEMGSALRIMSGPAIDRKADMAEIDDGGCSEIARRSRGTPRVANRILRRVRDFAQVRHDGVISHEIASEALELFEVDDLGLERIDREILRRVAETFSGGPVGLSTLAVAIGEEPDTLEDVYEPYLLQMGLLQRTPRGRVVTNAAYRHLGLTVPDRDPRLF